MYSSDDDEEKKKKALEMTYDTLSEHGLIPANSDKDEMVQKARDQLRESNFDKLYDEAKKNLEGGGSDEQKALTGLILALKAALMALTGQLKVPDPGGTALPGDKNKSSSGPARLEPMTSSAKTGFAKKEKDHKEDEINSSIRDKLTSEVFPNRPSPFNRRLTR